MLSGGVIVLWVELTWVVTVGVYLMCLYIYIYIYKRTRVLDQFGSSILVTPHVSVNMVKMGN